MSNLTAQIQEQLMGDGLIILAKDWRVLGSSTYIEIKNEVVVLGMDPHDFVGSTYITSRSVRKIALQVPSCEAKVAVLVSCPDKSHHMLVDVIRTSFAEAVDFAFTQLPVGTTIMNLRSRMCHTLAEKLSGAADNCRCITPQYLKVQSEDVVAFGKHLQQHMMRKVRERGQQYDCCLMIHRFGQSQKWTEFCNGYILEPRFADQMIVHVARDYSLAGKCLLWNLEKLQGFARANLQGEEEVFHPLMTVGHANVEYDRTKKAGFAAAAASGMTYAHVKFYTNSYKEVHRVVDGNKPSSTWKQAVVMRALTGLKQAYGYEVGRHPDQSLTEPKDVQQAIERIKALTETIRKDDHNTARIEAIIVAPGHCLVGLKRKLIWNAFLKYFERNLFTKGQIQPEKNLLNVFEYNDLLVQINETIVKAYKTLKPIIDDTIERRNQNEFLTSIPNYETVQLAVVCESLIAFSIYGRLNYYGNKAPEEQQQRKNANHNGQLIKDLKLKPLYYKEMIDENPFHGLENCGRDLITHGNRLSWKGNCSLEKTMWCTLVDDLTDVNYNRGQPVNARPAPAAGRRGRPVANTVADPEAEDDADALHNILLQLNTLQRRNFPDEYDGPFTELCEIIWKTLIKHCNSVTKAPEEMIMNPERRLIARIATIRTQDLTFCTAKTFVEDLFGQTQYLKYIGFAHYLRDMYQQLNPPNQLALRKKLVLFIEDKLLTLESPALLYPFGGKQLGAPRGPYYAILPFSGGTLSSYARAGDVVKRRIKILYSCAFERCYGAKCIDQLLHDSLSAASTFEGRWTFDAYMNQLESKGVADFLSELYCSHVFFDVI